MKRQLQLAVTVFLHNKGKYLVLHRHNNKKVDAGRLNGIGGKVEDNETFLETAIRETKEETGFSVDESCMEFCGLVRTRGGYPVDWLVCFFKASVPTNKVPVGSQCREGKFLWLKPEDLFTQGIELVDDLHYLFEKITSNKKIFFANIRLNDQEKVEKIKISYSPFDNLTTP